MSKRLIRKQLELETANENMDILATAAITHTSHPPAAIASGSGGGAMGSNDAAVENNDDLKSKFEEHSAAVKDLVTIVDKLRASTVDFEKQLDEKLVEKQKILEAVEKELQELKDEICKAIQFGLKDKNTPKA